ncbi:MAG: double-strand break repair helicase AddA [Rhodospirillaceae bacterium]|nr:double-strand break repair helicase AddA [Rhodospirillaceae bacterium]|tara:strand:- start:14190 stop:17624 length:3435 start_codon:yes stop_codon:yes gene_type:complete
MKNIPVLEEAQCAQDRASDPHYSVWVGASAGTGKTKVLTDRVLSLLLEGTPPHKILCLTFTRASAAEMSNRINRILSQWAISTDNFLCNEIEKLVGDTVNFETLKRARGLFRNVLETPGGMKIQTLHSFCESLLARFPLEAGIAPHFTVMDEREAKEAYSEAQTKILSAAVSGNEALSEAIECLAYYLDNQRFSDIMRSLLSERSRLSKVFAKISGPATGAEVYRRMNVGKDQTQTSVTRAACLDKKLDKIAIKDAATVMLHSTTATNQKRGKIIADWLSNNGTKRVEQFNVYKHAFIGKTTGCEYKTILTKKLAEKFPEKEEVLQKEAKRLLQVVEKLNAVVTAEATTALLTVCSFLYQEYEEWKNRHGRLDYDDLVIKARTLFEKSGGASWVLYKLDEGIDHILLDEAQDTNPDQWAVVAALAQEFFSGDSARDLNRTIFAVGDTKQSIYSFQRAEPAAFERMRRHFRDKVTAINRQWDDVSLKVSFRSTEPILNVVDKVFSQDPASDGVIKQEQLRHIVHRAGEGGYVEMWPPVAPVDQTEDRPWELPIIRRNYLQPAVRLAKTIAGQIDFWLRNKEILESQGRPIRPGDIMVLVRRRGGFVDHLVRELKALRIPVAGIDRMILGEQLSVLDLIALGEFLLLPEDDLNLATVLKGPLFGLTDDDLFVFASERGNRTLWQSFTINSEENPRYKIAFSELSDLLSRADFVPPYELFADVLTKRTGRKKIVARLGLDALDPIDEFLAHALSYEKRGPASLQGFIQSVSTDSEDVKRDLEEGTRDEVRIMTVHGSKGLQAPIVFLPDTITKPKRPREVFWTNDDFPLWAPSAENAVGLAAEARDAAFKKQDQEYRRLLYVALTRAEDRLTVCGWETHQRSSVDNWYSLVKKAMQQFSVPMDLTVYSRAGWRGTGFKVSVLQTEEVETSNKGGEPHGEAVVPPEWMLHPPPPEECSVETLAPSLLEEDLNIPSSPTSSIEESRFKRGLIIHKLLQYLPEVSLEQRQTATLKYLGNPIHGLTLNQQNAIANEIFSIIQDPQYASVFSLKSRAEVPITGLIGASKVSGKVDRLVVGRREILIIDYKSKRFPPQNTDEVPINYLKQMAAYRAVLEKIWPQRKVSCAILWTIEPRIMMLDSQHLESLMPG